MNVRMMMLAGAICAVMVTNPAEAQTREGWELGTELIDYEYRELYQGEEVAKDDGRFFGLGAAYTNTFRNGVFLRGRLNVDLGSVDYEADGGTTRLDNVEQSIGRLEVHAGRDVRIARTTISPFIGLAVRVLIDESGGRETEDGFLGYDRRIAYRYVPVGAAATLPVGGMTTLTLSGQYNRIVGGSAESLLAAIDPEFPDVKVDLEGGSGYELAAIVGIPVGGRMLRVGPFLRGWHIDRSKSVILEDPEGSGDMFELFEPRNRTTEAGVRLSFAF